MDHLSILKHKHGKTLSDIYDALNLVTLDELNIYNQAYLELDQPLVKNTVFHPVTKYEIPIVFGVQGDLTGQVICLLDTYDKNIKEEEKDFFHSLYIESMNILLGKMMTNLEDKLNLSAMLENPLRPKENSLEFFNSSDTDLYSMGYKFISNSIEYDARIIFKLNKKRVIEV